MTTSQAEARLQQIVEQWRSRATTLIAAAETLRAYDSKSELATSKEIRGCQIRACANDLAALLRGQGDLWQPIETAPAGRKVFVTWVNALGKRRTALASYWPEGTLDMSDEVPEHQVTEHGTNLDAGWWEESEGNDEAMFRLVEQMTHWMPLPTPPVAALLRAGRAPQQPEKKEKDDTRVDGEC